MARFRVALTILMALLACAAALAADCPAVGTWTIISTNGEETQWTMKVTEQDGKLAGTLSGDPGEFPLVDPKMDGDAFSFRVTVGDAEYTVQTKIAGKKLEGSYKGGGIEGTLKGDKQS
jgi:hypothetical protein